MGALDKNLLSFTLWNYAANNTNARGDGWNDEDLSLFSRDQQARVPPNQTHTKTSFFFSLNKETINSAIPSGTHLFKT